MRPVTMCFSLLQVPRCRIGSFSSFFCESFRSLRKSSSSTKFLASTAHGLEGEHSRRWIRRPTTTSRNTESSKSSSLKHKILDETVLVSAEIDINKPHIKDIQRLQYCDCQEKIAEKDFASLVTVIVFDIETTGFSRENDRIIEIALQDLAGGENSTFQTLVNPGRSVPNTHVHGITTHMVNRPDVPRMEDLLLILLQYVKSRQKPGGSVLLVAHNARSFDVPFLKSEFSRCSIEIPQNWFFVDTLPLGRELMKVSSGSKISSGTSLEALRVYYQIELHGRAHRALADVNVLSLILQRLTFDLKLTVVGLYEKSFSASDLGSAKVKKKKNMG